VPGIVPGSVPGMPDRPLGNEERMLRGSWSQAAGICAFSQLKSHVLLVRRRFERPEQWRLPQGDCADTDGSAIDTAIRVCDWETAYSQRRLTRWAVGPYVIRLTKGATVLRSTLLFAMTARGDVDEFEFTVMHEPRMLYHGEDCLFAKWFQVAALNNLPVVPNDLVAIQHFLALDLQKACSSADQASSASRPILQKACSSADRAGRDELIPVAVEHLEADVSGVPGVPGVPAVPGVSEFDTPAAPPWQQSRQGKRSHQPLINSETNKKGRIIAPLETWVFEGKVVAKADRDGKQLCCSWNAGHCKPPCKRRHACNTLIASVPCEGNHRGMDHHWARLEENRSAPSKAKPSQAKLFSVRPGQAGPDQAKPSRAKPSRAAWSQEQW
jgi:hypothetical protein